MFLAYNITNFSYSRVETSARIIISIRKVMGTMTRLYCCVTLLVIVTQVYCHSTGIGIDSACQSMTPGHGVAPQNSSSPYYVIAYSSYIIPGELITVYIGSDKVIFKGFMIQARNATSGTEILGNFTVVDFTRKACNDQALVHNSTLSTTGMYLNWLPPSWPVDDVFFRATFVQSKAVFWTNVESRIVQAISISTTKSYASYTSRLTTTSNYTWSTTPSYTGKMVLYKDSLCGYSKGCFSECNGYGCDFLVSWYVSGSQVMFTIKSSYPATTFYTAIGLSSDRHMGNDSVFGCVYSNGQIYKFSGRTIGHEAPALYEDYDLYLVDSSYSNGILTCMLSKPLFGYGQLVDLSYQSWTMLFAKGVANIVNGNIHMYYHESDKFISSMPMNVYYMSDISPLSSNKEYYDEPGVSAASTYNLVQMLCFKCGFAILVYASLLIKLLF